MNTKSFKFCPHCGESLLANKEELPARLTKTQEKVLAFCHQPRTSKQIADHLGMTMSAMYNHLRVLQRLDQLEKIQEANPSGYNHGCTFVATGKPLAFDRAWMTYTGPTVMGVRL